MSSNFRVGFYGMILAVIGVVLYHLGIDPPFLGWTLDKWIMLTGAAGLLISGYNDSGESSDDISEGEDS